MSSREVNRETATINYHNRADNFINGVKFEQSTIDIVPSIGPSILNWIRIRKFTGWSIPAGGWRESQSPEPERECVDPFVNHYYPGIIIVKINFNQRHWKTRQNLMNEYELSWFILYTYTWTCRRGCVARCGTKWRESLLVVNSPYQRRHDYFSGLFTAPGL